MTSIKLAGIVGFVWFNALTGWGQTWPYGASDTTYGLRSRIVENPNYQYTPSPADWRDINIYQLFTDRFADGDPNNNTSSALGINRSAWYVGSRTDTEARNFHHGGDWKGLQQNIPYLKGMGVNAVWISGVQMNDQGKDTRFTPYHMYHPTDFFKVDPVMGTFQDLKNVIDALHANGIYVILDVVINHTADKNGLRNGTDDKSFWSNGGPNFGWWNDSKKHAEPFNELWHFHGNGTINNWDAFPETLLGQFKGTDDLATETPHVTYWITEAFKNLIDATDCDGFRVDAIKHVEYNWVKKWADDIRKHAASRGKSDFILFGELFVYDNNALASYCKDEGYSFNSALFFPMSQTIKSVFIDGGGSGQLTSQLNNRLLYGEGANRLVTFIDNHDVNRISIMNSGDTGNDIWKLRPALSFLYLAAPVPCLFYGTEHAFNQGNHFNGSNAGVDYDDADWQRETMFDRGFQPGPAQGNKLVETNAPLYQHIAKLNDARKKYRSLTRGDFTQRWETGGQGPYAFSRVYENQEALVALNTADGNVSLQPNVTKTNGTEFVNVLNPAEKLMVSGGKLSITLAGKETKVFVAGTTASEAPAVWTQPGAVTNCGTVTIYYNAVSRALASANPVYLYIGQNGFRDITNSAMTWVSNSVWSYTYAPTTGTKTINFVFNDGAATNRIWDNNSNANWNMPIDGCGEVIIVPHFAVTYPENNFVVTNTIDTYTIMGVASNLSGPLRWTNNLTGQSGLIPATSAWTLPDVGLGIGTNVITLSGFVGGPGGTITSAYDRAANYNGGWIGGASLGTGFGGWTLNKSVANAGHFTGNSGFGLWSYQGDHFAAASLAFNSALASGQTFSIYLKNGWIWEQGGSVGFALRDNDTEKFLLYFNGGSNTYSGSHATDIGWTDSGLNIAFSLTGANSYSVTITPLAGAALTYTGTFTGSINNFRAWSSNNGTADTNNPNRDFFFDYPAITSAGVPGTATNTQIRIIRLPPGPVNPDANDDGVPDSWMIQHGFDINTPATNKGANGMSHRESFLAGLNPHDETDFLGLRRIMKGAGGHVSMSWNARPKGSYKVMASRNGVAGPYNHEVASRATEGGGSYEIIVDDPESANHPHSFYMIMLDANAGGGNGGGVQPVIVSASPGSMIFTNIGGLPVTLNVSGGMITNATYTIDTTLPQSFTNGQIVLLGTNLAPGGSLSLSLFGQNASGSSDSKVYNYTFANTSLTLTNVVRFNTWPPNGEITSTSDIWIDVFAQPRGAGISADIIYCAGNCTGAWTVASMNRNPSWDNQELNTEWWNINLGSFPAGTQIRYAVVVRDYRGAPAGEVWDSNNGTNYLAVVNSDGGGSGGNSPPSTNPTFGQAGTVTIDGANTMNEWSDSNLIALDLANDDPRTLGNNWTMHEAPADLTHLWARWDDTKLYLAWQFADITDVLDSSNAGSAAGGSVFNSQGILQFISFDTGAGGATNYMWQKFDSFAGTARPDAQIAMRSDLYGDHPYLSRAVNGAFVVDKDLGTNYFTRALAGIQIAKSKGLVGSSLKGVGDIDTFINNPSVALNDYVNHDKTRDTFYEMSIPLSTLGITRAQIESSGIAVFLSAGSASAIDSIPNDPSTLNTPGVTGSNSTWEWEDGDGFNRPFARIGK